MRVAAPEFGAVPLIAARVGIAAIFLIVVLARRRGLDQLYRNAPRLTFLGAINSAIPFSLFAYAVLSVTAGFASVLNSTAPLFGALVAFIWLRERPAPTRIAGLIVGFAGVLVLVWGRVSARRRGRRRGGARWIERRGVVRHLGQLREEAAEPRRLPRDCDRQPRCGDCSSASVGDDLLAGDAAEPARAG